MSDGLKMNVDSLNVEFDEDDSISRYIQSVMRADYARIERAYVEMLTYLSNSNNLTPAEVMAGVKVISEVGGSEKVYFKDKLMFTISRNEDCGYGAAIKMFC